MYIHSAGKKARSGKTGTGKKTVLQKKYEKVKQELATFMEHKKKCEALQEKGGRIPEDDSWNATPHICFRRSVISTCKTSSDLRMLVIILTLSIVLQRSTKHVHVLWNHVLNRFFAIQICCHCLCGSYATGIFYILVASGFDQKRKNDKAGRVGGGESGGWGVKENSACPETVGFSVTHICRQIKQDNQIWARNWTLVQHIFITAWILK